MSNIDVEPVVKQEPVQTPVQEVPVQPASTGAVLVPQITGADTGNQIVKINESELRNSIGSIQGKLSSIVENLNGVNHVRASIFDNETVWFGKSRDALAPDFKAFTDTFDSVNQGAQNYVNFMNNVLTTYTQTESNNQTGLEVNKESQTLNGGGILIDTMPNNNNA